MLRYLWSLCWRVVVVVVLSLVSVIETVRTKKSDSVVGSMCVGCQVFVCVYRLRLVSVSLTIQMRV